MRILSKNPLKLLLAICLSIALPLSAPAYADFAEEVDAYNNGAYVTALTEFKLGAALT